MHIFDYYSLNLNNWLGNSSRIVNAGHYKDLFITFAIENPQIYNFLAQVLLNYDENNEFMIPSFVNINNNLKYYKSALRKISIKLKSLSFF